MIGSPLVQVSCSSTIGLVVGTGPDRTEERFLFLPWRTGPTETGPGDREQDRPTDRPTESRAGQGRAGQGRAGKQS